MPSMFDAMKKAAETNPEFKAQFEAAAEANETKRKQEADAKRLRAAVEYRAKMEREAKEAQEKEAKRREQEVSILGNPQMYPFGYVYPHMGAYTATYGIIFALTSADARSTMIEEINKEFSGELTEYEKKDHEFALERLRVWQLDLSEGRCGIGSYME